MPAPLTLCPQRHTIPIVLRECLQACHIRGEGKAAIAHAQLDIKIVLIQNSVLGLVRQIQDTPTYPAGPFGVALDGSPDFTAIAAAYGIPSRVIGDESEIDGALEELLHQPGARLLICRTDPKATTND